MRTGRTKRRWAGAAPGIVAFLFLSVATIPAEAQARPSGPRLGLLMGRGSGPVGTVFGGVEAAWAFGRSLEVGAELSRWSDWSTDCIPESHLCSMGGTAALVGAARGVSLGPTAALRVAGSLGRYAPDYGDPATALGVGAALDIYFGSRVALSPGARWLTAPRTDYEKAVGEALTFTMFVVGLRLAL